MARAIWSGVIGFGMVSIPVKLYTATSSKSISFHQLHAKCKTRIKEQRFCPTCEEVVDYDDIVKGYEYGKGNYVVIEEEDLESLPLPSKNIINVSAFVKEEEIDPIYFNGSYYLEPDKAAERPFALLMEALEEKEMCGIATLALRNKERLCALRRVGGTLMVEMLLYPDEIRVDLNKEAPNVKVTKQELQMATTLIDLMAQEFDPEQYKDHYKEALSEMIQAKLEGKEIVEAPEPKSTKVVDLMDALRASVENARGGGGKRSGALQEAEAAEDEAEDEEAAPKRKRSTRTKRSSSKTAAHKAEESKTTTKKPARKRRGAA